MQAGVISGNAQRKKSEPLFRFTLHVPKEYRWRVFQHSLIGNSNSEWSVAALQPLRPQHIDVSHTGDTWTTRGY